MLGRQAAGTSAAIRPILGHIETTIARPIVAALAVGRPRERLGGGSRRPRFSSVSLCPKFNWRTGRWRTRFAALFSGTRMRRFELVGLTLAAALSAASAHADEPAAAAAPKPAGSGGDQGVTAYPAVFFDDARPGNAMDMISRLPGFTFDGGAQVRGFAGAAGNVLIDGERPTTKQDDLQQILRRIPAELVDHIDVIRGGAPGIDMQGRTIIANVVRKKGASATGLIGVANQNSLYDGRNAPTVRLEGALRNDGRSIEGSFVTGGFMDNGVGPGPHTQTDNTGAPVYNARVAAEAGGWQTSATAAYEQPFLGGKLRINALLFDQYYNDQEDDRASLPATGGNDDFHDRPTTDKGELGLHFTRDFGGKLTLETLALQQAQRRTDGSIYNAPGDFETFYEADDLAESILRATVRYRFTPQLTLQASAEGAYNIQKTWTGYYVNAVNQPAGLCDRERGARRDRLPGHLVAVAEVHPRSRHAH
jgi:hypothetical protein